MKLKWNETLPIFPDQPMWYAVSDAFSFIITQDEDGYTASAKALGSTPYDGQRHDLGGYCAHETFESAQAACNEFLRSRI